MAGTIPLSLTQQFDEYGKPLAGGQLYIIQAGTVSTPQDAFQDVNLTIKMPYPMVLDAAGRVPQFFLADGYVKVRLQDVHGVVQLAAETIMVIGPSSGSGGPGATVDPNALIQTGNVILRYGVGKIGGYVRMNGLTIGSHASASEFDDPSTQALFQYLWNADATTLLLPVLPSRGASASLDFSGGKQITLPDWRSRVPCGLDDMGNSPAGLFAGVGFATGNAITLGSKLGLDTQTIQVGNLPPYTPLGTITEGAITSTFHPPAGQLVINNGKSGPQQFYGGNLLAEGLGGTVTSSQTGSTFAGTAQGGLSNPLPTVQPTTLCTFYLRL